MKNMKSLEKLDERSCGTCKYRISDGENFKLDENYLYRCIHCMSDVRIMYCNWEAKEEG